MMHGQKNIKLYLVAVSIFIFCKDIYKTAVYKIIQ